MKKISLNHRSVILVAIFCFAEIVTVLAGIQTDTRSGCKWWRKRYWIKGQTQEYTWIFNSQTNADCSQASAYVPRPHCAADGGNGYNNYDHSWNDRWWAQAGSGYTVPESAPDDSIGFSKSYFGQDISFDATGGRNYKGQIKVDNIIGNLYSHAGTNFGAMYRIVIWQETDTEDNYSENEEITTGKIVWEAGVYINGGSMVFTGNFSGSDFSSETIAYDFTNPNTSQTISGDALRVYAGNGIDGISKSIDIQDIIDRLTDDAGSYTGDISKLNTDNLVVTILTHTGYGDYSDPYEYNDSFSARGIANGLNSVNKEDGFNCVLYPNPANAKMTLGIEGLTSYISNVKIIDSKGRIVKTLPANTNTNGSFDFSVADLPDGLYRIIVINKGKVYSKSFSKL